MPTTDPEILRKLRAVRALRDSTTQPGERASAQTMFEALLKKHGLTEGDLDRRSPFADFARERGPTPRPDPDVCGDRGCHKRKGHDGRHVGPGWPSEHPDAVPAATPTSMTWDDLTEWYKEVMRGQPGAIPPENFSGGGGGYGGGERF